MSNQPDFTLYDRQGRPAAFVEVKNLLNTSPEWAARYRQNLMGHGLFRGAKYVIFVTPDRMYFWDGQDLKGLDAPAAPTPPSCIADARAVLRPYFERTRLTPDRISSEAFELIVLDWLSDLVHARDVVPQGWLSDSGLLDSIKGGRVDFDAAA